MILDNHYAVVFKASGSHDSIQCLMTKEAFEGLKELSQSGHFVILEAWDITKGKCVSN